MASDLEGETPPASGPSFAARWWRLGKFAISFCLIAYLAVSVEWPRVWAATRAASIPWLALGLFSIPAGILFISLRYCSLVNERVSLSVMLRLVVFQGAVSTFLANAAGSLSFIGILIKLHKLPAELAIQSTIIARLADMLLSLIVASVLAAMVWHHLESVRPLMRLAVMVSVAILLLGVATVIIGRRLPVSLLAHADDVGGDNTSLVHKLLGLCARVIRLDAGYVASILPKTLAYSFVLQAVVAVSMYCNAYAFHLNIGFFEAAFVGVVSSFIASIPITVVGGLGVYEVSTVGLLALFGVPVEAGAGMILVVRTIFFLVMAITFFVVRQPSR